MWGLAAAAVASAVMSDVKMIHMLLSDHLQKLLGLMQSRRHLAVLTGHVREMMHAVCAATLEAPIQPV